YPFVCRPQLLAQPPFRGPIRPRPGAIRVAEMNSGIAICQEDVAASFRSRIQVKNRALKILSILRNPVNPVYEWSDRG
ncbi:hypothetical protein, partial [Thiocystis violacea]|uniref:hypothetical protein n=1 Tax=Thiocystis violacea TaxID=13725 RepID=UPI001A9102D1